MREDAALPTQQSSASSGFWFWIISALILLPWIYYQSHTSVNSDVAWLSLCAERLLHGGSFVQDCYDTNPPLSTLIYIPFMWLSDITGVAAYHMIFWISLTFIAFGTYATNALLRLFPSVKSNERRVVCLAYLFAITVVPTIYYAERDHYLAVVILPVILLQLCITYKYRAPFLLTLAVLILGGITLLLKPHYGLIPAILLLHRIKVQKRLWGIFGIDAIGLAVLASAYVFATITFYPDFVSVMLPDILETYMGYNDLNGTLSTATRSIIILFIAGLITIKINDETSAVIKPLWLCAALCAIVYIMQMKGFTYQRLPLYAVLFPLCSLLVLHPLACVSKKPNSMGFAYVMMVIMSMIVYTFSPIRAGYATHTDYKDNKITQYIDEHCEEPCAFYITHNNMDIISQLGFYSKHTYATRFPSFWFMTAHSRLSAEQANQKTIRYGDYIAEDLMRYNPSLLFILAETPDQGEFEENEDVARIFMTSEKFREAMSHYKKTDRLTIDRAYFYKDTPYDFPYEMRWDVYKKDISQ